MTESFRVDSAPGVTVTGWIDMSGTGKWLSDEEVAGLYDHKAPREVMKRARRPRQTVTFTAEQMAWLVGEAERLGVSLSEVVRRLVEGARAG